MTAAVIFDLDGVLVDSEQVWDEVRRRFVLDAGGRWKAGAQRDMMGMSSTEWSRYVRDELAVDEPPEQISEQVVARLVDSYRTRLPLLPGARAAVKRLAARWPLGLASSSNREVIDLVLELSQLAPYFQAAVSSEETAQGKPAPDVYLEAARRLEVEPQRCVAVEDSHNGILSARAARMAVVAVPNRAYPPGEDALRESTAVVTSLDELSPSLVESAARLG
jgi:HAD superfamily hydrolase (TIGR01509 family)